MRRICGSSSMTSTVSDVADAGAEAGSVVGMGLICDS
jgi:hypothetical protein